MLPYMADGVTDHHISYDVEFSVISPFYINMPSKAEALLPYGVKLCLRPVSCPMAWLWCIVCRVFACLRDAFYMFLPDLSLY